MPGLSDHIRVRSILGRFLEHSRIFWFGNGGRPEIFIGSADMMHRNLDRRVETLARVESGAARRYLERVLRLALDDNVGAWELEAAGAWQRVARPDGGERVDLQEILMRHSGKPAAKRKGRRRGA
jgi:polyphosphate kinase